MVSAGGGHEGFSGNAENGLSSAGSSRERQSGTIRILIADDHLMFREGLTALFRTIPGHEVIGEASDGEAAVMLTHRLKPDLLLLDLAMPRQDGFGVLQELSGAALPVKVLILASIVDHETILRAVQLGAHGVILKTSSSQMLLESVHRVIHGGYWIGQDGVATLVEAVRDLSRRDGNARHGYGLTPREREIVAAIVAGYSNYEIAQKLSLSEQTVKHHLTSIFNKLGIYNRLELALYAINHHLSDC